MDNTAAYATLEKWTNTWGMRRSTHEFRLAFNSVSNDQSIDEELEVCARLLGELISATNYNARNPGAREHATDSLPPTA